MESSYITSAQKASQLPEYDVPEVAFLGRSNCGKSSLLNALANHKNLARSSSTPGRTQMANFFRLGKSLILADLPGYGYNVASKQTQKMWTGLMEVYFERENIREFLFLLDCRRELDVSEVDFIERLAARRPVTVVMTKTDKINATQTKSKRTALKKALGGIARVEAVSSLKKKGITEMRNRLLSYAQAENEPSGREDD